MGIFSQNALLGHIFEANKGRIYKINQGCFSTSPMKMFPKTCSDKTESDSIKDSYSMTNRKVKKIFWEF